MRSYLNITVDFGVEEDEHHEWQDSEDDESQDVVIVQHVVPL